WIDSPLRAPEKIHLGFTFQAVKGGYLPTAITFQNEKGDVSGVVHLDYGEAGNFRMPRKVSWSCDYPGNQKDPDRVADSLAFYNYEINGAVVESPLPQQPSVDGFYRLQEGFNEMFHAGVEFHLAFGPFLSNSPQINSNDPGYNGDFGIGFEFTPAFSLSADYQGADYKNKQTQYDFYANALMLKGKYRFFTDAFRPFLEGGLGVGFTDYFPEGNFTTHNQEDVDLAAEAGAGMEVELTRYFFLYAQTGYVVHPLAPSFAQMAGVETPFHYVPLQFGVVFER
ncbi:MAG TPA: hypothetical protein VJ873_14025, partial [bacterium]|nr:hypothetical protein [bacterium]